MSEDDGGWDMVTVCDMCDVEIPVEESNDGVGDWDGSTLCNECYAKVSAEVPDIGNHPPLGELALLSDEEIERHIAHMTSDEQLSMRTLVGMMRDVNAMLEGNG